MIAAQKIILVSDPPPRHIQMHSTHAVMIVCRHLPPAEENTHWQIAAHGIGEIAPDNARKNCRVRWERSKNVNLEAAVQFHKRSPRTTKAFARTRTSRLVVLSM